MQPVQGELANLGLAALNVAAQQEACLFATLLLDGAQNLAMLFQPFFIDSVL
jgi:hypothetical protein